MKVFLMGLLLAAPAAAQAQQGATGPLDPLEFARLKPYGALGPPASPALPALQEALLTLTDPEIPGDDVQVAGNICYALGEIGPAAEQAIPALKKFRHHRMTYIADEAIDKIEGHPTPKRH